MGRPPYTEIREPGNLPFCWYGKNTSRSRVIDCTVDGCQLQSFCYSVKGLSVFPVLFYRGCSERRLLSEEAAEKEEENR